MIEKCVIKLDQNKKSKLDHFLPQLRNNLSDFPTSCHKSENRKFATKSKNNTRFRIYNVSLNRLRLEACRLELSE